MKYLVPSYSSNEILFSGNWIMGTESNGGAPNIQPCGFREYPQAVEVFS